MQHTKINPWRKTIATRRPVALSRSRDSLRELKLVKKESESSPIEASKKSFLIKASQSVIKCIEFLTQKAPKDRLVGKIVWNLRDLIIDYTYDKLKVPPVYAFRVQTGLPITNSPIKRHDTEELVKIAEDTHPELARFLVVAEVCAPRLHEVQTRKEQGFWFHIKRSFTTGFWSKKEVEKKVDHFLEKLEQEHYFGKEVILQSKIPAGTEIGKSMCPNITSLVSDIGYEMLIPMNEVLPKELTKLPYAQRAEYTVKNYVHMLKKDGIFKVPTTEELEKLTKGLTFKYHVLDLIKASVDEMKTLNDADAMFNHLSKLQGDIFQLAVKYEILDSNNPPSINKKSPQVTFFGVRFGKNPFSKEDIKKYYFESNELKKYLLNAKTKLAETILGIDITQPFDVTFVKRERTVFSQNLEVYPCCVVFSQGNNKFPATINYELTTGKHPDDFKVNYSVTARK